MYTNINNKEELKSFLDEAGYFHDGVQSHAMTV